MNSETYRTLVLPYSELLLLRMILEDFDKLLRNTPACAYFTGGDHLMFESIQQRVRNLINPHIEPPETD